MKKALPLLISISVVLITFTRCDLLTGSRGSAASTKEASVSFETSSSSSSPVTYIDSTSGDSITIDTAKVLISKMLFYGSKHIMSSDSTHGVSEDSTADEDSTGNGMDDEHEDSVEVRFHGRKNVLEKGPFVLNVSLDSTVSTVAITDLPQGSYDKIFFLIHKLRPGEQVPDNDFIDTASAHGHAHQFLSIVVKGTYNGTPFVFTSSKTFFVKTELNPPLTVSDSLSNYNATIRVNLSQWFTGRDGHIIDPTDPSNEYLIDMAIRRSFHSFMDNDKDGHDDHSQYGHGHENNHGNGHGDNGNHDGG